jgi:hypothetical protein
VTDARLPSGLEAAALMRRASRDGDFATVLHKGDADRGALLLVISTRGQHVTCLERVLGTDGGYRWQSAGPTGPIGSTELTDFLARRTRFDEDSWIIELDVAQPERFIAETTSSG